MENTSTNDHKFIPTNEWESKFNEFLTEKGFKLFVAPDGKKFTNWAGIDISNRKGTNVILEMPYTKDDGTRATKMIHAKSVHGIAVKLIMKNHTNSTALNLDMCYRCNGNGKVFGMEHVHNGVCFRCGGMRYLPNI